MQEIIAPTLAPGTAGCLAPACHHDRAKDIVHVSAMGPPGGGRTEISGRLKRWQRGVSRAKAGQKHVSDRHYNAVVAADMSRESRLARVLKVSGVQNPA